MNLKEKYTEYLRVLQGKSEKTIEDYCYSLRSISITMFDIDFSELTIDHIKDLSNTDFMELVMKYQNNSNRANTIKLRLNALKSLYNYLFDIEVIDIEDLRKKFFAIDRIKKGLKDKSSVQKEKDSLSIEDSKVLFNHIRKLGGRYETRRMLMYHLMLFYGLRRAEVCSLNVSDFDFNKGYFTVLGKGDKVAKINLLEDTRRLFNEYIYDRYEVFNVRDMNALFISRKGGRISGRQVSAELKNIISTIDDFDSHIHPHALRRSFATLLKDQGLDIHDIKERMRHANISTTSNVYINTMSRVNKDNSFVLEGQIN